MSNSQQTVKATVNTPASAGPGAKHVATVKMDAPVRVPQGADGQSALLALLKVEAEARDATTERDLHFLIVNETRKLARARQVFVLRPGLTGSQEVKAISSLPAVDRSAPLVHAIERLIANASEKGMLGAPAVLELSAETVGPSAATYPFRALIWLPLRQHANRALGGIVLAREDAWSDADLIVPKRLASAYAHALQALSGHRGRPRFKLERLTKLQAAGAICLIISMLCIRVPLAALAPVEITLRDPFVVAAPIDGVIDQITVEPNQAVNAGDVIVKLTDTTLRNRLEVAEREVQVAEAKLKQANQVAFSDERGLHEIAITRSELALKLAERNFARDILAKTDIRAERSGLAIYSDKRELTGRPVATGERILEVADATAIEARIELPVADAIAIAPGARVKLFLDSDPLRPWIAQVKRADYKARLSENSVMSFRVIATLEKGDGARPAPRLGVHGTAQISGDDVPVALYLFRRPLSAARQWLGW